jgi:hypothetical protein
VVYLQGAGEYEVQDFYTLIEELTGLEVLPDPYDEDISRFPIVITPEIAGQRITREELLILLGAHGVHLISHGMKEGPVLILTRDRDWKPRKESPRQFTKSFQVSPRSFGQVREEVERYIEDKNRYLLPGKTPATLLADPRSCRVIVRANSKRDLAGVEEIIVRRGRRRSDAPHLHTFLPRHRAAVELHQELLEKMSPGQKKRITIVIPRRMNALMIRASNDEYEEIKGVLESLDVTP